MRMLSYAYASRNTALRASSDFPSRPLASQVSVHVWLSFFPPGDFLSSTSCPRPPSPVYLPSLSLSFAPLIPPLSIQAHSSLFSLSMPSTLCIFTFYLHFLLTHLLPYLLSFLSFSLLLACECFLSPY